MMTRTRTNRHIFGRKHGPLPGLAALTPDQLRKVADGMITRGTELWPMFGETLRRVVQQLEAGDQALLAADLNGCPSALRQPAMHVLSGGDGSTTAPQRREGDGG
jgi:hypothetical protein